MSKSKYGLSWSVLLSTTSTRHSSFPKHIFHIVARVLKEKSDAYKSESVFLIANKSWQRFLLLSSKTNRMWFSVELLKLHWFGINWHVFNRSECRNCCLYTIIQKIAPQAESGKYFQIWFSPDMGKKMGAFWACACKLSWTLLSPARVQSL